MGQGPPGLAHRVLGHGAAYLGDVFDIHGGGIDLIFPHHENELAQSRCVHGTRAMANYWLHNEFVQLEDTKMSKSLGNFVTIRDLLADWPGEVLRLNMLKAHYRSPMEWTLKGLEESTRTLDDWYAVAADIDGGRAIRYRVRSAVGRPEHAADDRRVARIAKSAETIAASLWRPCGSSVSCPRAQPSGSAASSRQAVSMPASRSIDFESNRGAGAKRLQGIRPYP